MTGSVAGHELAATTVFRRRSGTIHAESHEATTSVPDGDPIAIESGRFRNVKVLQFGGETAPYPKDLAPLVGCAVALRGLEFERGSQRGFTVWLANVVAWEVAARVEKEERIDLPTGSQAAWRVRVRPSFEQVDAALDHLIDVLMPPLVAHFAAEPPHRLLRFEFPTGPFKQNPQGVLEATELR